MRDYIVVGFKGKFVEPFEKICLDSCERCGKYGTKYCPDCGRNLNKTNRYVEIEFLNHIAPYNNRAENYDDNVRVIESEDGQEWYILDFHQNHQYVCFDAAIRRDLLVGLDFSEVQKWRDECIQKYPDVFKAEDFGIYLASDNDPY